MNNPRTRYLLTVFTVVFLIVSLAIVVKVMAQSSPNLIPGKVPTAAQWNSYFAAKWDYPGSGFRAVNKNGDVMIGLLRFSMGAPTISGCGTGPSVRGNNQAGEVTMGAGSPTGCTITFNTANPFAAVPSCVVTWQVNLASMTYSASQTAITVTQTATSSNKINYHCNGLQ